MTTFEEHIVVDDKLKQAVYAVLAERGIIHEAGPPAAYFEVVSTAREGIEMRVLYCVCCGRGFDEDSGIADTLRKFIGMIPPAAKAVVWRVKPTMSCEKDFSNRKTVWNGYLRCAFLDDASIFDRIVPLGDAG